MSVGTLRRRAYQQILGELLSGELRPGSRISEPSLVKQLGIGRTPVREAIQQLEVEGLVERTPRRDTVVRTPERRDIIELYELREGLESHAVMLAAERIGPDEVAMLGKLCEQMRLIGEQLRQTESGLLDAPMLRRFLAADMGFHMLLIRATGNRRIMKVISDSHVMTRIFGTARQTHDLRVVARSYLFHSRILRALGRRQPEAARSWMARHIRTSRQQAVESFDHRQTAGEPIPLPLPDDLLEEFSRMELTSGADVRLDVIRSTESAREDLHGVGY